MRSKLIKVIALIAGAIACGCAATTIQVPRMKPAEVNLGPIKKVAVSGIDGEGGADVADGLTQSLMQSGRFEVLDRQHLASVQKEQGLAALDEGNAAQVGKVAGAGALIFGRVAESRYGETVEGAQGTCFEGGQKFTCTDYTRTGAFNLAVTFKVVDTASGRILATKTVRSEPKKEAKVRANAPKTNDAAQLAQIIPSFNAGDELRPMAVSEVVSEFMKMVAPYQVMVATILYDESDLPSTKRGVAYARAGDWAGAIAAFEAGIREAEAKPDLKPKVRARAIYNLGVALGYSGQYEDGIAKINEAYGIEADERFLEEISKIKEFRADDAKLKQQQEAAEGGTS